MSRADAMSRTCPLCGAFAGQRCVGKRGPRATIHRARYAGETSRPQPRRQSVNTEQEIIDALVRDTLEAVGRQLIIGSERFLAACQSPIERVFAAAVYTRNVALLYNDPVFTYTVGCPLDCPASFPGLHIYPQTEVDGYRLDFLFVDCTNEEEICFTVVECDGHDYHERTKQQASHDKRRDRHFTKKGWKVVRFTGSDIWADPAGCVEEAISIARGLD